MRKSRRAFTLVEILVVSGILIVLAGLMLPVAARARRRAYEPVDISNMHQLYLAFAMYREDHSGTPDTLVPLRDYVREEKVFKSLGDVVRKPYGDGSWPSENFVPCKLGRSPFQISYAYLRSFPPYNTDESKWRIALEDPKVGILASPWAGSPIPERDHNLHCGDSKINTMGPAMDGPILRVNMDGSFFRFRDNRYNGFTGNPDDLFIRR